MDEIKQKNDIAQKFKDLLEKESASEKTTKEILIKRAQQRGGYEETFPGVLGITLEKSVDLYMIVKHIMNTVDEGSKAIKMIEKMAELTEREKLFVAFKIGTIAEQMSYEQEK